MLIDVVWSQYHIYKMNELEFVPHTCTKKTTESYMYSIYRDDWSYGPIEKKR